MAELEFESNYRFRVHAHTRSGQGAPNSADAKTLPEALRLNRKFLFNFYGQQKFKVILFGSRLNPSLFARG
jgi:hypothetical protein